MIKLQDLITELRSVKNLDKVDTSKPYRVFWQNGDISAGTFEMSLTPTLSKIITLSITPNKKTVRIEDFDDWSSFKSILKFQQAIKDVIKLKLINPDWKIEILLSDVKKNIGSGKVSDFLKYDATFVSTIPKAFHGTTSYELKSINKLGIVPPNKNKKTILKWNSFYVEDSKDKTYWTIDFARAKYYAEHATQMYKESGIDTTPIVIEVHNLPIDKVTADDDFRSNMSMIQLLAALEKGGAVDNNSAIQSIRNTSQFAYKGRVPPSMIVKIHKV